MGSPYIKVPMAKGQFFPILLILFGKRGCQGSEDALRRLSFKETIGSVEQTA